MVLNISVIVYGKHACRVNLLKLPNTDAKQNMNRNEIAFLLQTPDLDRHR